MTAEPVVHFDPFLVEESVLLAIEGSPRATRDHYRRERDTIYDLDNADEREVAFLELDARWFERLGLGAPLLRLLQEHGTVLDRVSRTIVLVAGRSRDEGADLHDSRGSNPTLAVKLTPRSLLVFDRIAPLLRSELLHVEDMLDPAFGYDREPHPLDCDPMYEKLVRDRFRVLWNTSVDGRLQARGLLSPESDSRSRRDFVATFALLGPDAETHFERFFRGPRPSQGELLSFARSVDGRASGRCPLCRFPTAELGGEREPLDPRVRDALRRDFPRWSPSEGICRQCADLYEARLFSAPTTARTAP
jgi:hypothetical protein